METNEENKGYRGILRGTGASHGIKEGKVKLIKSYEEVFGLIFEDGDILVAEKTYPDLVIHMTKASAIVTDKGGMLSHAAIVSREIGIPCVVGTIGATNLLEDGMIIKVDGTNGIVYIPLDKGLDEETIQIEQEELNIKNPGLSYVYKEIYEELDEFLDNYNDINFRVSEEHNELVDRVSSFMYQRIIEIAIPLMKDKSDERGFKEWMNVIQKALDFYKNTNSVSEKVIAITWMDKIIRATSLEN